MSTVLPPNVKPTVQFALNCLAPLLVQTEIIRGKPSRSHSEAKFSHGICTECNRKLYPELASAIEAEQGASAPSEKAGAE